MNIYNILAPNNCSDRIVFVWKMSNLANIHMLEKLLL